MKSLHGQNRWNYLEGRHTHLYETLQRSECKAPGVVGDAWGTAVAIFPPNRRQTKDTAGISWTGPTDGAKLHQAARHRTGNGRRAGPVTRDYLDRHLAGYYDDYQKRELSPSRGGGREEVILLHVCDRMKSQIRIRSIARDPANGFITRLTPLPDDSASSEFDGRFVNLLEGRAH